MHQNKHTAVLTEAVLKYLDPKPGESYLDLTAGYGGHAELILGRTLKPKLATLVDRDQQAVSFLRRTFVNQGIELIRSDFLSASLALKEKDRKFDLVLADLGVSSPHLKQASRGFSIKLNGPLDMRMDQTMELTASSIVNNYDEADIAKIIKNYAEDPRANKIAHLIVSNRPILDTEQLASIIKKAWPRYSKIHPATRTFQALRIVVNDELNQLASSLPIWIDLLNSGGRLAVISFHSLEDRMVKTIFKELSDGEYDSVLKVLTKHPIKPSHAEIVSNPQARSAKLRAAVKIKTERGSELNHADSS